MAVAVDFTPLNLYILFALVQFLQSCPTTSLTHTHDIHVNKLLHMFMLMLHYVTTTPNGYVIHMGVKSAFTIYLYIFA